ncbi:MAG TPA: tRNA pseudouridine synthase A [Muribaculum sp.]|jgi:tRNA pseudouridine38-40 synthase|uniref:tRNA pseudouridine synthase A n=1 Tax=Heminiphilus faecis TaxID=2601703 RepID=A0ABV4D050_9BACT|nr:tRNA pseudouridine synthase A [Heminiphilus faecis]RLT76362.1 tRNA pseudouridine(38-40) synthase TruA [bacterium J10(2018)]HRF68796.1 tRNA pseudouridine synthase A [Muribaculum sp.]
MSQRYFMRLAYNGAPFHGWQSQPNAVSVQSTIEEGLSRILGSDIRITGAGRTDTGVNARVMVAHFDVEKPLGEITMFLRSLNALTGRDIAIEGVWPVHSDAHARFDAVSRTYHYYTHSGKSPFLYTHSWQEPPGLDFDGMNRCGSMLLDIDDFTSFAKLHSDNKTNLCRVTRAEWMDIGNGRHVFVISADRFLRNMVRAVVGTLIDVGRGKMSETRFMKVVEAHDRCAAGTSMPPQPLFLWDVTYPYDYAGQYSAASDSMDTASGLIQDCI